MNLQEYEWMKELRDFRDISYFEETFKNQIGADGEIHDREFVSGENSARGKMNGRLKPVGIV